MVSGHPRGWCCYSFLPVGCSAIPPENGTVGPAPRTFPALRIYPGGRLPTGLSLDGLALLHAQRTSAPHHLRGLALSDVSGLRSKKSLARVCLVCDDLGIFRVSLCHSSAPDIQRKTLLVSGDAFRRTAVRSVRESQPFCGICGDGDPGGARATGSGEGTPRETFLGGTLRHGPDCGVAALCFPRRDCQLRH